MRLVPNEWQAEIWDWLSMMGLAAGIALILGGVYAAGFFMGAESKAHACSCVPVVINGKKTQCIQQWVR